MKFGIRAHDVHIFDDMPALSDKLKDLGFSYLQFAPRVSLKETSQKGYRMNAGLASYVQRTLAANGISIATLGCYGNMEHPDLEERERFMNLFSQYITLAHNFGAPLVVTETGTVHPGVSPTAENFTEAAVDLTIKQIQKQVKVAEKAGVLVGIEPGINHPIHDVATIDRMLNWIDSPNLKLVIDPVGLVSDKDPDANKIAETMIEHYNDIIYGFHINDYRYIDGKKTKVDFGTGEVDLPRMVKTIEAAQPHAIMELDGLPDLEPCLKYVHENLLN